MDLGPGSLETLRDAMHLARACGATITLLHAIPREGDDAAAEAFCRFSDILFVNGDDLLSRQFLIRPGRPADVILAAARELDVDAILLRGEERGWRHLFGSSVLARLQSESPCPVCVVPWSSSYGRPRDPAERLALEDSLSLQQLALVLLVVALGHRLWGGLGGLEASTSGAISLGLSAVAVAVLVLAHHRLRPLRRSPGEEREAALARESPRRAEVPMILVPMGLDAESSRIVPLVRSLSEQLEAKTLFLHTTSPADSWAAGAEGAASKAFAAFRKLLAGDAAGGLAAGFIVRIGNPVVETAQAACDLEASHVVVCADGGWGLPHAAIRRLQRCCPCPVWLVPPAPP